MKLEIGVKVRNFWGLIVWEFGIMHSALCSVHAMHRYPKLPTNRKYHFWNGSAINNIYRKLVNKEYK